MYSFLLLLIPFCTFPLTSAWYPDYELLIVCDGR